MVFCGKCGKDNPVSARFCENCGENIAVAPTPQRPQPGFGGAGNWVSHQRAGFLVRFIAYLIDGIILGIVGGILSIPFGVTYSYGYDMQYSAGFNLSPMGTIILLIIGIAYEVYFVGARGATPGKMALKLKVIGTDGRMPIGYGGAIVRFIGTIISSAVLLLGYIWIIIDKEKQGWHDKIANTYVVKE